MSTGGGPRPTHALLVLHKDTGKKGRIGAAWDKGDGSFSIVLEAGVSISWRDGFIISLFPANRDASPRKSNKDFKPAPAPAPEGATPPTDEEEIPF